MSVMHAEYPNLGQLAKGYFGWRVKPIFRVMAGTHSGNGLVLPREKSPCILAYAF